MRIHTIIAALCLLFFTSCGTSKLFTTAGSSPQQNKDQKVFIENISINLSKNSGYKITTIKERAKLTYPTVSTDKTTIEKNNHIDLLARENYNDLQEKYFSKAQLSQEELYNTKLLETMDFWYGTPYRFGGNSKSGIDCSAFIQTIMSDVYEVNLPRTARSQYQVVDKITKSDLQQGDLVFFNTRGGVSHVGLYIGNNKFIHASTKNGVIISDLNESYWSRTYISGGRTH